MSTKTKDQWVPVHSSTGERLMPCHPSRARELLEKGKAKKRWKHGLFYIKLTERATGDIQKVGMGGDPGSKWEAISIVTAKRTIANYQSDARTDVKDSVKGRSEARRARRFRNTPYREDKKNRSSLKRERLPNSTRARYEHKLRQYNILHFLYPISHVAIEEISAGSRAGKTQWNQSFNPLQVGKRWFAKQLEKLFPGKVKFFKGYDTSEARRSTSLPKTKVKSSKTFDAHCVDAYILARLGMGLPVVKPTTESMHYLEVIKGSRRSLHAMNPTKGGIRKRTGGTQSLGFTKGSVVQYKDGIYHVGGWQMSNTKVSTPRLTLKDRFSDKRIFRSVEPNEVKFLARNSWRVRMIKACN